MSYSPNFRGTQSKASARQTITDYQNGSGSTLAQCTPVATNNLGQLVGVDPSNTANVLSIVGLANLDIPSSANGPVIDNGRLENATIGFSVGDSLYLSKAGFLQNTPPVAGFGGFVTGDYLVFIGVVVQNEFNPSLKDIKLMIERIGLL